MSAHLDPESDRTSQGRLDEEFLAQIGRRIREVRTARGWTVQHLADRAGVSRRLLTQVELGQANPSLVAITRIARELGTDFRSLLDGSGDGPVVVATAAERRRIWASDTGSWGDLLQSAPGDRTIDLWRWQLLPGDVYQGRADQPGSTELFHVLAGSLTLCTDDQEWTVAEGGSARLASDRAYSYENRGDVPVVFVRTVALGT